MVAHEIMGDYNMKYKINPTKHTLPCQFLIKLGMIEYVHDLISNASRDSQTESSWFNGFVTGLHEASVIDDKTYDELMDEISRIVYPIE